MISIALIVIQEIVSKYPAAEFDLGTIEFIGDVLGTPLNAL